MKYVFMLLSFLISFGSGLFSAGLILFLSINSFDEEGLFSSFIFAVIFGTIIYACFYEYLKQKVIKYFDNEVMVMNEIKEELTRYNAYIAQISYIENRLSSIDSDYINSHVANYGESSRSGRLSDETANTAIRISDTRDALAKELRLITGKVDYIKKLINTLKDYQKQVIIKRYIENKNSPVIAYEVDKTEKRVKEILREAVRKMEDTHKNITWV